MKRSAQKSIRKSHFSLSGLVRFFFMVPVLFIFFLSSSLLVKSTEAATGINRTINFQGKLVNKADGTNVTDGTYTFTFKIFNASTAGSELWGGASGESQSLTVTSGVFQAALGSVRSFATDSLDFNQDNLWLEIGFNGETFGSRIRLASVPYALTAEKVGGITGTSNSDGFQFAGGTTSRTATVTGADITLGNVIKPTSTGGLTVQSNGASGLTLDTGGAAAIAIGATANSITFGATNNPSYSFNGTGAFTVNGGGANNITFGSSTGNGNVVVQPNAGGQAALEIIDNGLGDLFTASAGATTRFVIQNGGNVGIGTANPTSRLQIGGGNLQLDNTKSINFLDTDGTSSRAVLTEGSTGITILRSANSGSTARIDLRLQNDIPVFSILTSTSGTSTGFVGIGPTNTSPLATLDVRPENGTVAVASVSGKTSFASLVVDQSGLGDIFSASSSGLPRFTIGNTGAITGTNWSLTSAGALTVASCSGCSGAAVGALSQVPTSNTPGAAGANVIQPTAASIVGLTINSTSNATAAQALIVNQTGSSSDGVDVNLTNTSGTVTNGLSVTASGTGGTTTNGLQITQSGSATLVNGLTFSGTFTKLINSTNFNVTNAGAVSDTSESITPGASTTGLTITQNNVPTVDLASISNTSGQESTTNGIDGLQITWFTKPSTGNMSEGEQISVTNKNTTTAGQANGLRVTATGAGTGVNSNTVGIYIDPLASASNVGTGENAIQIGSGWDNAISAAGNIELESKTNTASTADNAWTNNAVAAGKLNTTTAIASISASAVYNGSLYAGTFNNAKAEVYRYNGTGTSWTALNATAGQLATTTAVDGVTSMAVYNGYLYAGTSKVNGGTGQAEIYRYDGGTTWTSVMGATPGTIGGVSAIASVSAMTVWNGDLYAGVCKTGAAEIFKYQGGTTWLPVSGAGTIATTTGVNCITSLVSYNNFLIAGDAKPAQAEVYRYTGGTTWIRLNPTAGTFTMTSSGGTAASSVDAVTAMTVYDGHLVVGLRKNAGGDVVEYIDNTAALAPVNDWARLNNAAGTVVSGGNTINSVSAMGVYNGRLYIGTESTNGAEIFRYDGGEIGSANFTKVSQATKGQIGLGSTTNIDMISQLLQYNNDFWAGTYEPGGAEMYMNTVVSGQSYALKFHAAATQAEQNGLQNLGSISFVASPSANVNTAGGGTGAFVFSNTIQTVNGAYDVAEDYPTRDQLIKPGDLVAIDGSETGLVKRSQSANSTSVIGVYSEHPGFDLSQTGNSIDGIPAIPVALVGRVPVNVSTESGAIQPGDYITSSSIPGIGMKATTPGPIIGQALEKFDPANGVGQIDAKGIGQVLVFVSHGYFNGISQNDIAQGLSGLSNGELAAVQFIGDPARSQPQSEQLVNSPASTSALLSANQDVSLQSLSVLGLATVSGDFRVKGNGLFEGIVHVVDTLMVNNFITNGIADFFGNVIFHGDVAFQKAPSFGNSTAGFAIIHKDANQVDVVFKDVYPVTPVINASMVSVTPQNDLQTTIFSQGYSYVVTNVTAKGFSILLNKKAAGDVEFSWNAFLVPTPTIFESASNSVLTPEPTGSQILESSGSASQ